MKIAIIGDNGTCKAARMLLRHAGFAVQETPARAAVRVWVEERPRPSLSHASSTLSLDSSIYFDSIYFDSIDSPLEAAVARHVSQLSQHPIVIDRPGGSVRSDRELRIVVPDDHLEQQHAVQLGLLRGLLDFAGMSKKTPRWKKLFGLTAVSLSL